MYSFPTLEPFCCSMSGSNACFLICTQVLQEAGKVVLYSHLFKNFPQNFAIQKSKSIIHLCTFFFIYSFPLWFIVRCWIQLSVLYSRTLRIHPTCSLFHSRTLCIRPYVEVYTYRPRLPLHPYPLPSPWQQPVCSLRPWFCFCFTEREICVIF